jgi:hypothetical protein
MAARLSLNESVAASNELQQALRDVEAEVQQTTKKKKSCLCSSLNRFL